MQLQVLVATMNREDLSLTEDMNLRCDAVIANQCGKWAMEERTEDGFTIKMLSSDTVGVGKNRNLALTAATADILLFADDDIRYYDGELKQVVEAFRQLPDADVIFFAIDMTKNGEVFDRRRNKVKKLHLWNSLRYGACRMAVRREAIEKHRLRFTTLFGGGCIYGSGEDTALIVDCFRAGLKVYSHDYVLGACAKDSSSWFHGYNEKYCFDRGALVACAFPKMKHLIKWHFARKTKKSGDLPLRTIIKEMNRGIRAYSDLRKYEPRKEDA